MLREVKNKHVKPTLTPFQATISGSTATVGIGYGDYTATGSSTVITLTARNPYARTPLVFPTGTSVNTGGAYGYINGVSSTPRASFLVQNLSNAAAGVDGTIEGFVFGWDSTDLSICKSQIVTSSQSRPRTVWGKITGSSGAVAIGGGDFTCTRASAGVYNIIFKNAFGRTPVVMAQVTGSATSGGYFLSNKTAQSVTVNTYTSSTGNAGDFDFYLIVSGSDSRSDSYGGYTPLQNSQRFPRIIAGQIIVTAGTPAASIGFTTGGADFSNLVDVGTGSYSFNMTEVYKREPAIFAVCQGGRRAQIFSNSNGAVSLLTFNSAGAATDATSAVNFFIIGSDDRSEY